MDQRDLIRCIRKYRTYDNELKALNTQTHKLRENKKIVEMEMGDILRRPTFAHIHKLDIADDGSYIKIQRPEAWNKPWNLSAREMQTLVEGYFKTGGVPTAEGCVKYMTENRKRDLVAKEFSFTRVMPVDDNNDDESGEVVAHRTA